MKVTLDGQVYEYDSTKAPMSEALAIEQVYQRRYVEWKDDLTAGSARAMCVLAWIIWRRDGRDIQYEDIIDGTVDFDIDEMLASIIESAQGAAEAEAQAEPDPTTPGSPAPAGTHTTGTGTSASSRSGSGSGRGKSAA